MKNNQKVNSQTIQDIETEAEKVLKIGMKFFKKDGYIMSAAFFYGPKGRLCLDDFNFNHKSNPDAADTLREIADKVKATMVIIIASATLHNDYDFSKGKGKSTSKAIFVYAEDKNTKHSMIQEFQQHKNGGIQFGEKRITSDPGMFGRLTGFVNTKLRLANEARTNRSVLSRES